MEMKLVTWVDRDPSATTAAWLHNFFYCWPVTDSLLLMRINLSSLKELDSFFGCHGLPLSVRAPEGLQPEIICFNLSHNCISKIKLFDKENSLHETVIFFVIFFEELVSSNFFSKNVIFTLSDLFLMLFCFLLSIWSLINPWLVRFNCFWYFWPEWLGKERELSCLNAIWVSTLISFSAAAPSQTGFSKFYRLGVISLKKAIPSFILLGN